MRLCPAGAAWQSAHAADACLYTVSANGTPGAWHDVHAAPKCFAGGVWHVVHSCDDGCEKTQLVPGWWHVAHSPRASWLGWWHVEHGTLARSWHLVQETGMWVAVVVLLAATRTATAPDELSRPGLRTSALASASNVTLWPASEWHVTHGPAPACALCENFGPVVSLIPA